MEVFKSIASFIMGTFGVWMLWRGKKKMDTKMMLWGGVLIVLSYFMFSGGSGDDTAKNAIKNLTMPTPEASPLPPQ